MQFGICDKQTVLQFSVACLVMIILRYGEHFRCEIKTRVGKDCWKTLSSVVINIPIIHIINGLAMCV